MSVKDEKKTIKLCNDIVLKFEDRCQCYNKKDFPSDNINKCAKMNNSEECNDYNICKKYFKSKLSGSEPSYDPQKWNPKFILNSHNCYTYFLNDHNTHTIARCKTACKQDNSCGKKPKICSRFKPQPGKYYEQNSNIKLIKKFNCSNMINNIKKDNKYIYTVDFEQRCKRGFYKGAIVVENDKTYHFYRQDKNTLFSHKPGILKVVNTDATGNPIYCPHLADRNYRKNKMKGINYETFCSYLCVPSNYYIRTNSI
jgi:hypothetical protein